MNMLAVILFVLVFQFEKIETQFVDKFKKNSDYDYRSLKVYNQFANFMRQHHKHYTTETSFKLAYYTFAKNYKFVQKSNEARLKYSLRINQFGDRQLENIYKGLKMSEQFVNRIADTEVADYLNESLDFMSKREYFNWVDTKAVSEAKNQFDCAASWAFATVSALESSYFLVHHEQIRFSEEELIFCSKNLGSYGCSGGDVFSAIDYITKQNGLLTTEEYVKSFGDGNECEKSSEVKDRKGKILSYSIAKNTTNDVLEALIINGPLVVHIYSSLKSFVFYGGGIYDDPKCRSEFEHANHNVLLVGYGYEHGELYWIIKNSWSDSWGEKGFMKIAAANNICGVTNLAVLIGVE